MAEFKNMTSVKSLLAKRENLKMKIHFVLNNLQTEENTTKPFLHQEKESIKIWMTKMKSFISKVNKAHEKANTDLEMSSYLADEIFSRKPTKNFIG